MREFLIFTVHLFTSRYIFGAFISVTFINWNVDFINANVHIAIFNFDTKYYYELHVVKNLPVISLALWSMEHFMPAFSFTEAQREFGGEENLLKAK